METVRILKVDSLTRRIFAIDCSPEQGSALEKLFKEGGIKVICSHTCGTIDRHTINLPFPKSEEQVNTINEIIEESGYVFTTDAP